MIKRLFNIVRCEFNDLVQKEKSVPLPESDFFEIHEEESDPLMRYYSNLEIPVGSDRETIKTAWKIQLKKYRNNL